MKQLKTGQFHGQTNNTILLDGITLTDTEYTQSKVDWHYHENAYFTFILHGKVIEGNKKERFNCIPGSLLYHHWQEPHYNIKPTGYTRGFHIEINKHWFDQFILENNTLQGSICVVDPDIKLLLYQIFKEAKRNDDASSITIQSLVLNTILTLNGYSNSILNKRPAWVKKIRDILNDEFNHKLSLNYLVKTLDIHPVHLSRDFSKYFNCNIGEYIRKIKIEKSLSLLSNRQYNLTSIAFECGFADQSHFTRSFKALNGMSPSAYRKILFN